MASPSAWFHAATRIAGEVDLLLLALLLLSALVYLTVIGLLGYFILKYRAGTDADRTPPMHPNLRWEYVWTAIPLVIFLGLMAWAGHLYLRAFQDPPEAQDVYVVARQWMWQVQHTNGRREINELHVPIRRAIRLTLFSQDVIHSFFVPAFRIKHDVVPGRPNHLAFEATEPGTYQLFCAEYCGTEHAGMIGRVIALRPADYAAWLGRGTPPSSLAAQGKALFTGMGCSGCHGPGSAVHAPRLEGLYGSPVALTSGSVITADEAYLSDSILLPDKQIVAGFQPIMPSFRGQLTESQLLALLAYLKSLKQERMAPP